MNNKKESIGEISCSHCKSQHVIYEKYEARRYPCFASSDCDGEEVVSYFDDKYCYMCCQVEDECCCTPESIDAWLCAESAAHKLIIKK